MVLFDLIGVWGLSVACVNRGQLESESLIMVQAGGEVSEEVNGQGHSSVSSS